VGKAYFEKENGTYPLIYQRRWCKHATMPINWPYLVAALKSSEYQKHITQQQRIVIFSPLAQTSLMMQIHIKFDLKSSLPHQKIPDV